MNENRGGKIEDQKWWVQKIDEEGRITSFVR